MVGQRLGQAPVDTEGAAPVAVLLAVGDHGRVLREAVQERLEQGVAKGDHLRDREAIAVGVERRARTIGQRLDARVVRHRHGELGLAGGHRLDGAGGEHDRLDLSRAAAETGRGVERRRQAERPLHHVHGPGLDPLALGGVEQARFVQVFAVAAQAVPFLPRLDLLARAVGGRIARRVAGQAVRDGVQQRRAAAGEQQLALGVHGGGDRQRVVAVDPFGMQVLGIDAGAHARQHLEAHGLARGLAAHPVEVVHEVEHHRRGAPQIGIPEGPVLVHGGEAQRFPGRPTACRRVADAGDDDAGAAVHALEERRAGRDPGRAADDGVVRHAAERREEGVHGAAEPAVQAGTPPEHLRHEAVHHEVDGQVLDVTVLRARRHHPQDVAIQVLLHDALQVGAVGVADALQALGQDLGVAAVRAEDQVFRCQRQAQSHHRRLLTDRQVRRAFVHVVDARVAA